MIKLLTFLKFILIRVKTFYFNYIPYFCFPLYSSAGEAGPAPE